MRRITLVGIIDTDTVNYKKISMVLEFPYCTFKCGKEFCQNSPLALAETIEIDAEKIVADYINNPITEALVFQGLEPLDSWQDVQELTQLLRSRKCMDDIVVYTGYNKDEIEDKIQWFKQFPNIVIKYGRFIPNNKPHFDKILGVNLVSDNQYAEQIS